MFAFIKKWKLNTNFNLSFANFRKKWQLNTGFHFSLFISILYFNIKFSLISLPTKKWKMNMQFHFSFSTFRKKGMNRMQVRWSVLNNDHLFHSQSLSSCNSIAAPVTLQHSAYWRQTDEIVCADGNVQVPFNKGLFFVFLTCIFQKAWITDYVLRGFYKVKIWWRWRGVISQFHSLCRLV